MTEPIEAHIPTTPTLTQERLEALAESAQVAFEVAVPDDDQIDGIVIACWDEKAAAFWRQRGAIWGSPEYPHPDPEEKP